MGKIEEPWLGMEVTGNNDLKWIDCTSVSATFSAWNTGGTKQPWSGELSLHVHGPEKERKGV